MTADSQRAQSRKRDQYVNTLKRGFALAFPKKNPSTASDWAELFVSIEARIAKSLRDPSDAIGTRAAFQSGYGLFYTHEVRNGALEKRRHKTLSDRGAEQQCWQAFCERTGRDARSEHEKLAHKRAVETLKQPNKPTPKKRSAVSTSPRSIIPCVFPTNVSKHPELATTGAVFAHSYQIALGNGNGPRMYTWPQFRVQEPQRALIETRLRDTQSLRMRGCGQHFEASESAIAFYDWVQVHGFLNLSNGDMRELVKQARAPGKSPTDLRTSDLKALKCPPKRCAEEHEQRLRSGLVPLAFGSFNSVWGFAKDVKTCSAFLIEDMQAVVFRIPLRDAMRIPCSLEQAIDEAYNMLDAAHAGFGVPIRGMCLATHGSETPCHRVCAVMTRAETSCDRRIGNGKTLITKTPLPPLHPLRRYFESLNRAIWLMSLRRRLHLDTKLANFVDTFKDMQDGAGSIFAIDLDSSTYRRIGSDSFESSQQGWRPVYLFNALLISVQLRMQLRSEEYEELWWKWMREPLKTLLVQLQSDEFQHAYDSSFQFAAAFVRNLKWGGPLPERDLPDQPEFDDPNDLNTWLAEGYAGYYIYGAYSKYLALGGECCLKAQFEQARQRYRGAAFAEERARSDFAEWYRVNYRLRFAPMLRFFADRRHADRAAAPRLVEVMFEFANAAWDDLIRAFVDVAPKATIPRHRRWEPIVSEGALAARAAVIESDDSPSWRALACAATGVALEK